MSEIEFVSFPKIARLKRHVVVTEKIDGTNAQVFVGENGSVRAGSRTRWITPEDDNYGFAAWVKEHEDGLRTLGPGRHYGEWWGSGIQRRYGLTEKRFSLFNVARWGDKPAANDRVVRPACCLVVPVLYGGPYDQGAINDALDRLRMNGSVAAPGFAKPEGIVVFMTASQTMYKVTIEKDEEPKGMTQSVPEVRSE